IERGQGVIDERLRQVIRGAGVFAVGLKGTGEVQVHHALQLVHGEVVQYNAAIVLVEGSAAVTAYVQRGAALDARNAGDLPTAYHLAQHAMRGRQQRTALTEGKLVNPRGFDCIADVEGRRALLAAPVAERR